MDILATIVEQNFSDDSGELASGFLFASVKNTGSNPATVNSLTLPPGEAKNKPFIGKGYNAVPSDATYTTLQVMYIL